MAKILLELDASVPQKFLYRLERYHVVLLHYYWGWLPTFVSSFRRVWWWFHAISRSYVFHLVRMVPVCRVMPVLLPFLHSVQHIFNLASSSDWCSSLYIFIPKLDQRTSVSVILISCLEDLISFQVLLAYIPYHCFINSRFAFDIEVLLTSNHSSQYVRYLTF